MVLLKNRRWIAFVVFLLHQDMCLYSAAKVSAEYVPSEDQKVASPAQQKTAPLSPSKVPKLPPISYHKALVEYEDSMKDSPKLQGIPEWMKPPRIEILGMWANFVKSEKDIPFDRENMVQRERPENPEDEDVFWYIEGYNTLSKNIENDVRQGRSPRFKVNDQPWPHMDVFLKKIIAIQRTAVDMDALFMDESSNVHIVYVQTGTRTEYMDVISRIIWPADYVDCYIKAFNVVPSRAFYRYIMNFK